MADEGGVAERRVAMEVQGEIAGGRGDGKGEVRLTLKEERS